MFLRCNSINPAFALLASSSKQLLQSRTIYNIPHWERHIRFDSRYGRKRPSIDVLNSFKRLNNGMWLRRPPGGRTKWYAKDDVFKKIHMEWVTCTKEECMMLDKMMTPFWLRQKHYVNDPLEPYHTRYAINSPRVDDSKKFVRERPKILLEDLTADRFFDRLPPEKTKAELLLKKCESQLSTLLRNAVPRKLLTKE